MDIIITNDIIEFCRDRGCYPVTIADLPANKQLPGIVYVVGSGDLIPVVKYHNPIVLVVPYDGNKLPKINHDNITIINYKCGFSEVVTEYVGRYTTISTTSYVIKMGIIEFDTSNADDTVWLMLLLVSFVAIEIGLLLTMGPIVLILDAMIAYYTRSII